VSAPEGVDPVRHETHLFKAGDLWGWGCTCRASDGTHETRALAVADSQRHRLAPVDLPEPDEKE
jgi:hypothetical protein